MCPWISSALPARPPRLELRLLGGFEVLARGVPVDGFESRKARALVARLALEAGRPVARDQIAALLWPDLEAEAARRNLRQALYNVKSVLGPAGRLLASDAHALRLAGSGLAVDVFAFTAAAAGGRAARGAASVAALARALDLYRGELLDGVRLRENEAFDEWLRAERDRCHALAVEAAREALRRSEADGAHETALGFARRLGELEPLSEEAGRAQVRLLARLGRRSQALTQYAELARRLERELGVAPGEAAQALRRAILEGEELPDPEGAAPGPAGPVVPFVGRERPWRALAGTWGEVRRGDPRLTLVLGDRGTGKSRLVRWFLHDAFSSGAGVVLLARCSQGAGPALRAALAEAVASLPHDLPARVAPAVAAALAALPEAAARRLDLVAGSPRRAAEPLDAVAGLLAALTRPARPGSPGADGRPSPVALFVDDLEHGPGVLEGLLALRERAGAVPLWIVAAARADELAAPGLAALRATAAAAGGECLELGALERADVERAARALVGDAGAEPLAAALYAASAGHPLALAEAVNLLADEGTLLPGKPSGWHLADPEALARGLPAGAGALIDRRLARLPKTSRRLLGLAAVAGERFDTDTLLEVDQEHPAVLEAALGILVERWLVRPLLRTWVARRRDRDVALWKAGARRGPFEFAQRVVRQRIYDGIDPRRRRVLHRAIARALVASADPARLAEADHHLRAAAAESPPP